MPITLNHSNIGVQYNTGSNYIIETVKSDLYLRDTRTDITSNLLAEPTVLSPVFTETIRTFVHSGGTEAQTTHTITVGQNTVCDILIVGGGGGGGGSIGGGGGGGSVIYSTNITIPAGLYSILVGKGGSGGVNETDGAKGSDSTAFGATAFGGGRGGDYNVSNSETSGGSGGGEGGGANNNQAGVGVAGLKGTNTIPNTSLLFTNYQYYVNDGGLAFYQSYSTNLNATRGGGGGGAGTAGGAGGGNAIDTTTQGLGGDGIPISISGNVVYYGAGGGGGAHKGSNSQNLGKSGGLGGGGNGGNEFSNGTKTNGTDGTGFGAGGGGGAYLMNGGAGGSGIVIIKFRTIVNAAIPEGNPITYKTLNFVYEPRYPSISVDNTNLKAWYKFDGNYEDSSSSGFNLTNSGAVIVNGLIVQSVSTDGSDFLETSSINLNGKTYSISLWVKFNTAPTANSWLFSQGITGSNGLKLAFFYEAEGNRLRFSHFGSGNDMDTTGYNMTNVIGTSWHHYVITYNNTNRGAEIWFDGVKLNTNISTLTNTFSGSGNFNIARSSIYGGTLNGLMEDFRYYDKVLTSTEISQLYNIPTTNQYTLNFPVPTIADINNNSNIVLRGAYDISLSTMNSSIIPKSNQYIPKPTTFASDLLSIRYNLLNPVLDPSGAQLTYNTSNTNVYHMGNVGIGTKSPEYSLDVRGSVNAKSYYLNGRQINEPISELGLSEGMIAQVRHLTYTQMEIKNNTGWDAINDNLTTGFVIAITPKSNLSKILVNIIVHIGLAASNYSVWWGIKLYRKIGSGDWTEVTGPNGTETGSAAATAGTPVWISYTMYAGDLDYQYKVTNVTGTYLDSPNTTSTVYYTAYWNNRLGDNPSAIDTIYLNRAESHGDAYRPAPSSSWTASEIWYG